MDARRRRSRWATRTPTNFRYLNHFFETDQAQSVDELDEILQRNQGIPWVNTLAADSIGQGLLRGHLGASRTCPTRRRRPATRRSGAATFAALGLPVLDGSRSSCEWDTDPDAVEPGIFGPSHLPQPVPRRLRRELERQLLAVEPGRSRSTGFARIIGDERTERALRTRLGPGDDRAAARGHRRPARQPLHAPAAAGHGVHEPPVRRRAVARRARRPSARRTRSMTGSNGPVDVSAACPVLRGLGPARQPRLERRDPVPALRDPRARRGAGGRHARALHDAVRRRTTRCTRRTGSTSPTRSVEQSFADAVTDLRSAGIPLDAPLRGYQYERRGTRADPDPRRPGHASASSTRSTSAGRRRAGLPERAARLELRVHDAVHGRRARRRASILTYSQSTNPDSPYFADQTRMFSNKQWVDEAFCENEIAADPNLQVTDRPSRRLPAAEGRDAASTSRSCPRTRRARRRTARTAPPLAFGSCSPPARTDPGADGRHSGRQRQAGELERLRALPHGHRRSGDAAGRGRRRDRLRDHRRAEARTSPTSPAR